MDVDLLSKLYEKHYQPALYYVLSLCRNTALAEDIVSQAFERALLTADLAEGGFRYWLLRVCKNLWIDHLRRQRFRGDMPQDMEPVDVAADPQRIFAANAQIDGLYQTMQKLPPNQQEILTLFYFSEQSLNQIAALLEISPGNAKVRLHRARLQLKSLMEDNGHGR